MVSLIFLNDNFDLKISHFKEEEVNMSLMLNVDSVREVKYLLDEYERIFFEIYIIDTNWCEIELCLIAKLCKKHNLDAAVLIKYLKENNYITEPIKNNFSVCKENVYNFKNHTDVDYLKESVNRIFECLLEYVGGVDLIINDEINYFYHQKNHHMMHASAHIMMIFKHLINIRKKINISIFHGIFGDNLQVYELIWISI